MKNYMDEDDFNFEYDESDELESKPLRRIGIVIGVGVLILTICGISAVRSIKSASNEENGLNGANTGLQDGVMYEDGYEPTQYYTENDSDTSLLKTYMDYNEDVVAMIRINDSVLNHPIMYTPADEGYYLNRDLNKEHNSHGVPFLSIGSDLSRFSGNNIIYGHNIRLNGLDVFADLNNYRDIEYYKEHPIVEIITEDGTSQWLIFAYYLVDTSDTDTFVYFDNTEFVSMQDYEWYMGEVSRRSWINVPIENTIDDAYITLSSCSVELHGSGTNRMVVMARRLEVGEKYEDIVSSATENENPLLPMKLR